MDCEILLAEDEERMAEALVELFRLEGHIVDHMADGISALMALETGIYDIAVLDVMMPSMDGITVVRTARQKDVATPVLMLTAKGQTEDKVRGLDSGADDYLPKPFKTEELLARVRALGRRALGTNGTTLRFGDLSLDVSAATLSRTGSDQSVILSAKELHLLEYLMSNQTRILTRQQLAMRVWGFDSGAAYNNVEVYMSFIRKRIASVGSKVTLKAIRGIGYTMKYENVQ